MRSAETFPVEVTCRQVDLGHEFLFQDEGQGRAVAGSAVVFYQRSKHPRFAVNEPLARLDIQALLPQSFQVPAARRFPQIANRRNASLGDFAGPLIVPVAD